MSIDPVTEGVEILCACVLGNCPERPNSWFIVEWDRSVSPISRWLDVENATAWARDRMQMLSEPYGTTFEREGDELVLSLVE